VASPLCVNTEYKEWVKVKHFLLLAICSPCHHFPSSLYIMFKHSIHPLLPLLYTIYTLISYPPSSSIHIPPPSLCPILMPLLLPSSISFTLQQFLCGSQTTHCNSFWEKDATLVKAAFLENVREHDSRGKLPLAFDLTVTTNRWNVVWRCRYVTNIQTHYIYELSFVHPQLQTQQWHNTFRLHVTNSVCTNI